MCSRSATRARCSIPQTITSDDTAGLVGQKVRMPMRLSLGFALLLALVLPVQAQELKIASVAPEGSTWMQQMRKAAEVVKTRTEGRVVLKFYGGGVMGSDKKVLRKIRVGQLDGSTFTPSGLTEIYPDLGVYGLPLLFQSLDEVDRV